MTDGQLHPDSPSPDSRPASCDLQADTHVRPHSIGLTNTHDTLTASTCKKFGDRVLGIEKVSVNLRCRNF
jgi:hypothetical protein